ncbi:MAG: hypothetical protein R2867_26610 [Caldilineaceae bacterium]
MTNAVIRNNTANPGLETAVLPLWSAVPCQQRADYATGGIENRGVITVTNSTISGNRTLSSAGWCLRFLQRYPRHDPQQHHCQQYCTTECRDCRGYL